MTDAAFLETLRAAEAGESCYSVKNRSGIAGENDRLDAAASLVFAEGEGIDDRFAALTTFAPDSPFAPRATRLRLLRMNRNGLRKVFEKENVLSGPLFHALAAGPGPTMAKRAFADALHSPELVGKASDLRRGMSERAYPVYVAERAWLKHVGPSRRVSATLATWRRWQPRIPFIILGLMVAGIVAACVFSDSPGTGGSSGARFPVAIIIWPLVFAGRLLSRKSAR